MSEARRQAMEYVCQHAFTLQFVVYGGTVGLLLNLVALFFLEPGTPSHVVALVNFPGLLFFVAVAAVTLRKCTSYSW
jgi:hypothetical protein